MKTLKANIHAGFPHFNLISIGPSIEMFFGPVSHPFCPRSGATGRGRMIPCIGVATLL